MLGRSVSAPVVSLSNLVLQHGPASYHHLHTLRLLALWIEDRGWALIGIGLPLVRLTILQAPGV